MVQYGPKVTCHYCKTEVGVDGFKVEPGGIIHIYSHARPDGTECPGATWSSRGGWLKGIVEVSELDLADEEEGE